MSFYVIKGTNAKFISCSSDGYASTEIRVSRPNPPGTPSPEIKQQSWQLITILGANGEYYLRNDMDVYLVASGSNVTHGDITNATKWILLPQEGDEYFENPYYIRTSNSPLWMKLNSNGTVGLGVESNASLWDVQVQDEHPLHDQ